MYIKTKYFLVPILRCVFNLPSVVDFRNSCVSTLVYVYMLDNDGLCVFFPLNLCLRGVL